jgi:hypothetical protein
MQIKLNNGLTVDINPDTEFWCEHLWRHERIKSLLRLADLCGDRKFNTPLIHALIFKEYYAIVIDNGNGIVREFHSTREIRQKRIRHFKYLRQKTKN